MKKSNTYITHTSFIILLFLSLVACERNIKTEPEHTVLFFFPWSTNLTHYFENNIYCFENALNKKDLQNNNIFVFISKSETDAFFYKIQNNKGIISHDTIARFTNYNYNYTSTEGLSQILSLAKTNNSTFSLIIGCHGDAWIPSSDMKRSFGGTKVESRINISTLRKALEQTNIIAEYILFDDCYMSSIEVAYELRNVCHHLIASPSEIMAAGMPYTDIANDLINTPNYEAICSEYYHYYANNPSTPYGAIAIIKSSELDSLANITKRLSINYTNQNIQFYDAYNPHIFYDLGDYINTSCSDEKLKTEFFTQLDKCIIHKAHTKTVYGYNYGEITINNFSGVSTSAPSTNPKCASYHETAWHKATH
jgi:hypothetical protein